MTSLLAIALLSPFCTVLGPVLLALVVALFIFCSGAGISLTSSNIVALSMLGGAIPMSALFGATLSRSLIERSGPYRGGVELLALVLSAALALRSASVTTLFGAAAFLNSSKVSAASLVTVSLTITHALFAAGLAALVVSLVAAAADFIGAWFGRGAALPQRLVIPAVRQVAVILAVCAAFDLLVGLYSRELAPFTIVRSISG